MALRLWPAVERVGRLGVGRGIDLDWSDAWTDDHDSAVAELPLPPSVSAADLRILAGESATAKRHAIARIDGKIVAVVSLRRRRTYWEPVSYQCIPGPPIAASNSEALGKVLGALGVEVRIEAFAGDPWPLGPQEVHTYEVYQADLTSDFESHWHQTQTRQTRTKTAGLETRVDDSGDLLWTIDEWERTWSGNASEEGVAADDRRRLWPHLLADGRIHTIALLDDGVPVSAVVHYCDDTTVTFVCSARDHRYDKLRVGARVLDVSFHWAAEQGYSTFYLGGGGRLKADFAPAVGHRHIVAFRPPLIDRAIRLSRRFAS